MSIEETAPTHWENIRKLPVLVFQINAWKAKRWGVKLDGMPGDINNIFSQNAEHSLAITIKELLAYYKLTAADIINIVNQDAPRGDIGSMEVWIYIRNPHYAPKAT